MQNWMRLMSQVIAFVVYQTAVSGHPRQSVFAHVDDLVVMSVIVQMDPARVT
jgi:hypothetical protein